MGETSISEERRKQNRFILERKNLTFIIIPFLLFTFMLFRMAEIHHFYQGWIDPVYAYLMNGLTFALGSNDIGHVDHPGTPLQLFVALIIRLVGWLRGADDLATDLLTNPESYLRIICLTLIVINCVMLWMLGLFTYKNLKNRSMAITIQVLPLLTFQLVNFMLAVACEPVICLVSFALAACIILYDSKGEGRLKLVVIIALLSAMVVATKISALAILIIPIFFFEKIKSKAIYLLLTLLFIFIFLYPVLDKLVHFTDFLGRMATHTGKYGSGEEKLFDAAIYFKSVWMMLTKEVPFTLHLLLLPVGWVVITKRKIDGSLKRLYIAITLATAFQVLIVAKHYSFHYLMPVFALFMPLHGYFWIKLFREKISILPARTVSLVVILLVAGVFIRLTVKNDFHKGIVNTVDKTSKMIHSQFNGKYIIITESYTDAALIDPALRFGLSYVGAGMKKQLTPILTSLYSGNYLWNSREGFTDWSGSYLASDLFSLNNRMYIYANTESCEVSMAKISAMIDQVGMSEMVNLKNVYRNDKKGEIIALATVDTAKLRAYTQPKFLLETSIEELAMDGEHIKSNNSEYQFKEGALRSVDYAHSGKASLLITSSNPYGLTVAVPVSIGKHYKIEFWQRSTNGQQAVVVASANKSELYYKTSLQMKSQPGVWTRCEMNLTIGNNYPESSLHFYMWNPTADSIWIDDFRLMVYE